MRSMPAMVARSAELYSITGHPPMVGGFPDGCRFHPRCPYAVDACRHGQIDLVSVSPTQISRCIRVGEIHLEGTS